MKAAIYTPYLDTLGGGERYMLSAAKVLSDNGWGVEIQGTHELLHKAEDRFGLDFSKIKAVPEINRGDGYDLCLWLSDGIIPSLRARKNILHFQLPFYKVDGKSLINRMKFFRIANIIVNSEFTKSWIDREYPVTSHVLYPPVDITKFKAKKKQKNILYVGRFSMLEQAKRQDVLVEAFKKFHDECDKTWKLQLVGGSDVGADEFLTSLKESISGYPIEIIENASFKKLKEVVGQAQFFWSAAGFEVDEKKHPEKLEHFGMTVVEAMSAGCIPFVYNAGGHREIIQEKKNGFLWRLEEELIKKTYAITTSSSTMKYLSDQAKKDCQKFSYENFEKSFLALL